MKSHKSLPPDGSNPKSWMRRRSVVRSVKGIKKKLKRNYPVARALSTNSSERVEKGKADVQKLLDMFLARD